MHLNARLRGRDYTSLSHEHPTTTTMPNKDPERRGREVVHRPSIVEGKVVLVKE
jgi:hypothetical protein